METLGAKLPAYAKIIRLMPNMAMTVGKGVCLLSANPNVTEEEKAHIMSILGVMGLVKEIPEHLMDAGSALCGCSPAFTDLYMEAMADGAVACGIPRAKALKYAAAAVAGAARLALETGEHPGALKDKVCSPGGSTIQGVRALENRAFRGAVMEAVIAAAGASGDLGKK